MKQKLITFAIRYAFAACGWLVAYWVISRYTNNPITLGYMFFWSTIGWILGQIALHRKQRLARLKRQQNNYFATKEFPSLK